jgi:hypothetical protein
MITRSLDHSINGIRNALWLGLFGLTPWYIEAPVSPVLW